MERPAAERMVHLFLEGQLAETAVLLAVLVVAALVVRALLRLPAEVKPALATAALSPVPPAIPIPLAECAFRPGVTEVEREELMLFARSHAAALAPHGGLLALGAAREVLAIAPSSRERERARLLLAQADGRRRGVVARRAAGAARGRAIRIVGVRSDERGPAGFVHVENSRPEALADSPSSPASARLSSGRPPAAAIWQVCLAGRPHRPCVPRLQVFVDRAVSWLGAISAARKQGITPEQYGAQRIYWHERCLEVTRRRHAAGAGNGQYIHVIDFGGIDVGMSELRSY
eukprot:scaffold449_cov59-Phaeocystis_antarctica.AAC.3